MTDYEKEYLRGGAIAPGAASPGGATYPGDPAPSWGTTTPGCPIPPTVWLGLFEAEPPKTGTITPGHNKDNVDYNETNLRRLYNEIWLLNALPVLSRYHISIFCCPCVTSHYSGLITASCCYLYNLPVIAAVVLYNPYHWSLWAVQITPLVRIQWFLQLRVPDTHYCWVDRGNMEWGLPEASTNDKQWASNLDNFSLNPLCHMLS